MKEELLGGPWINEYLFATRCEQGPVYRRGELRLEKTTGRQRHRVSDHLEGEEILWLQIRTTKKERRQQQREQGNQRGKGEAFFILINQLFSGRSALISGSLVLVL